MFSRPVRENRAAFVFKVVEFNHFNRAYDLLKFRNLLNVVVLILRNSYLTVI